MWRSIWFTALAYAFLGYAQTSKRAAVAAHLGDDIEAVIRKLAAAGAAERKREFETTAEYEVRRAKVTPHGQLVFVVRDATTFEYDADAGEMTANVKSGLRELFQGSVPCPTVEAKSVLTRRGRYLGKNLFGITKVITSSDYNEFGICVDPSSPLKFDAEFITDFGSTKFPFPMDRDDARAAKPFLRLALAGTIAMGVIHGDTDYHSPTVTEPYETTTRYYYVPFRVAEVQVLDSRTGEQVTNFVPVQDVQEKEVLPRPTASIPIVAPAPKPEARQENPPTQQRIRIDGTKQQAMIVRQPKPIYPPLAKQARIQGIVRFNVIIGKDGNIQNLTLISGHPLLVPAAQQAVKVWTYKPTLVNGEAVEVETTIEVPFTARP